MRRANHMLGTLNSKVDGPNTTSTTHTNTTAIDTPCSGNMSSTSGDRSSEISTKKRDRGSDDPKVQHQTLQSSISRLDEPDENVQAKSRKFTKRTAKLTAFFKPISTTTVTSITESSCTTSDNLADSSKMSLEVAQLLKLEIETMGSDWFSVFQNEMQKDYFLKIKKNLAAEMKSHTVYPSENDIYSFTKYPIEQVRVVILGQDPYHNPGQAHGLCFSVKKGVPCPPSLVNIYKEVKANYASTFKIPNHGNLDGWSKQGVLLLNTALTVRAHAPASHSKWGWSTFTDAVIQHISNHSAPGVVFLLWGGHARKKKGPNKFQQSSHIGIGSSVATFCISRVSWKRTF